MHFLVPTINGDAFFRVNRGGPEGPCARDLGSRVFGGSYKFDGGKGVNVGDKVIIRKQLSPNFSDFCFC